MYDEILSNYTDSEIVQICKFLNKDYNIYEPDEVRWEKIKYAFYKTSEQTISELQKETFLMSLLIALCLSIMHAKE